MAVKLADAYIALEARVDELERDLDIAEKKTFEWSDAMGDFVGNVMGSVVVAVGQGILQMAGAVGSALIGVATQHDQVFDDARTQLGMYEDEAGRVADVARAAWARGFGESMQEAGDATITVLQNMGDAAEQLSDQQLQQVVERALAIRDGFEIEVGESTRVVTQLMNTMGLTADEAFALIVAGQQQGLDRADDWIDTLNEYSDDFAGLGLTAEEVLTIMNQGLEAGAFNTDKIADGLNEFSIRLKDPAIGQQIATIDDGLADLFNQFAIGEVSEREALQGMLERLRAIEDPIARDQAGVQLFGSMWEDLGEEVFLALDLTQEELLSTERALNTLNAQYDNLPDAVEAMKRRTLVALSPISEFLVDIANKVLPFVEQGFDVFEDVLRMTVIPTFEMLGQAVQTFFLTLRGVFTEAPPEEYFGPLAQGAFNAAQWFTNVVIPAIQTFIGVMRDEVIPAVQPVVEQIIAQLVPGLIQLGVWIRDIATAAWPLLLEAGQWVLDNFNIIGPVIAGVGAVLLALTSPIAAIAIGVVALATAWANNWGGIQEKAQAVADWITGSMVPWFQEAFENISGAIQTAGDIWETRFLPPIMAVWGFLNESVFPLIRAIAGFVRAIFNVVFTAAAGIWQNVLQPALSAVGDEIESRTQPIFEKIQEFIEKVIGPIVDKFAKEKLKGLANSFKNVKDAIQDVITFIKELTRKIENVQLPSWMQPGSPSPWEESLMRTNDLLQLMANARLPALATALQIDDPPALGLAGAGAGAGGGGTTNLYGDVVLQGVGLGTESAGRDGAQRLLEGLRQEGEA